MKAKSRIADSIRVNSLKLDPLGVGDVPTIVARSRGMRITPAMFDRGHVGNTCVEKGVDGTLRVWMVVAHNRYIREVRMGLRGDVPKFVGFVEEG